MWSRLVLCLVSCLVVQGDGREERLVHSPQGPVRGYKEPGDSIYAFYGIPYATAPTGVHKFQAPLPAPTWKSIFEAVDNTIICHQAQMLHTVNESKTKQENCLIANVYAPDTKQKNLPVVVYVHGGAYQNGYSNIATYKNLVRSKKVIIVTFNYRLGVHGFLCLGTDKAPGNAAMKDQVALLNWVKRHISSYGGNPDDVTIAGYSAGSSAVDLLMISPAARGLFNKVIPESGSSLATWSVQVAPLENAKIFARANGVKNVDDVYALEEFYTRASYGVLTSGSFWNRTDFQFVFTPCVERESKDAFLTESPYSILKSGRYDKVPMLYGLAETEGLMPIVRFETWRNKMNSDFSTVLPADLKFENNYEKAAIIEKIKEFFFNKKPVTENYILDFYNYVSDLYFVWSTLRAVNLHIKNGHDKIFLYEYNYVDDSTPVVPFTNDLRKADHCAQTAAISDGNNGIPGDETNLPEETKRVKQVVRELWLNFMTTGTPVPAGSSLPLWPATGAGGSPHMAIGSKLELRGALQEKRMRFWDDIYERHYREPQPPPAPPARPANHAEL